MNLICPVCSQPLHTEAKRFLCPKGHSFDRAKSGYVNLLRSQNSRTHGDDPRMVAARRAFLDAGYYSPLLNAIEHLLLPKKPLAIADIGCGEGWYSCNLLDALHANGISANLCGIDISADALRFAANRAKSMQLPDTLWAAATISHLPLQTESCDCILNLFAPVEANEFARILTKNGLLLRAIPLERHLWQLKAAIYPQPYENRPVLQAPEGFILEDVQRIDTTITVKGDDLQNLFAMTPYVRKTSPEDAAKLLTMPELTTELSFGLLLCQRA